MVNVNFRYKTGISERQIIKFFTDIGYIHRGTNKKSVKVEDEYLKTEEFVRDVGPGRYHLFIAFGRKYSGTVHYPQIKSFLHYDYVKMKEGEERHYPDLNECRNFREICRIEDELIKSEELYLAYDIVLTSLFLHFKRRS